jgi:hypothetical protein
MESEMYYLAIAAANKHVAERGFNKGQMVDNDAYRQVTGGPETFDQAMTQLRKLAGTSKPGTKIKLVITIPEPLAKPASEMSKEELLSKIAELTALATKAA